MKSSEQITKEILELESKLTAIKERISEYEEKKAEAETAHIKAIEDGLESGDLKRGPGPGDAFARIVEHGLQVDALRKAKLDLEARLNQAQSELGIARLYESTVRAFKNEESNFIDNVQRIEKSINALNKNVDSLDETINGFMQESGNPLDAIESLIKNPLLAGLSLKAFFAGEIEQAIPFENDRFIQVIGERYQRLANGLPKLRDIEESWMGLSNRLDALARQAGNLIPHRLKYHPAPQPKPKAEHGSTMRIPQRPPARLLTEGQKLAKNARKAVGTLHR